MTYQQVRAIVKVQPNRLEAHHAATGVKEFTIDSFAKLNRCYSSAAGHACPRSWKIWDTYNQEYPFLGSEKALAAHEGAKRLREAGSAITN